MLPTIPTPMTTTSTSLRRCTTFVLSSYRGGDFRMDVHLAVSVLTDAHGGSLKLHAMFVDSLVVVCISAGEPDHPPRHHVAIAAIHRVGEESLDSHPQQHVEEHGRGHSVEIVVIFLQRFQVGILSLGG